MPPRAKSAAAPKTALPKTNHLVLVCGEEEYNVKKKGDEIFSAWTAEVEGDREILDGSGGNSGEALKALARLHEALMTLPFFGGGKIIWFRGCNFMGEEGSAAVTEELGNLAAQFEKFPWDQVRLLITAGKVDKRRTFFKTVDRIGEVHAFEAWSLDSKNWPQEGIAFALKQVTARGKKISHRAAEELVTAAGPQARLIESEIEKVSLYVGEREEITEQDVSEICVQNKQAKAFALADTLGERNLRALLQHLDRELWTLRHDQKSSEIGLLYGLIVKVRAMLFMKALAQEKLLKPARDFFSFKTQLEQIPPELVPSEKKFSPLALNPYVLFKAAQHAQNYQEAELVRALEMLLECNQKLVSSSLDPGLLLQQTLITIVHGSGARNQGMGGFS